MSKTTMKNRLIQGVLFGTATLCLSVVTSASTNAQEKAPAPATLKPASAAELLLTLDDAIAMSMEKQPAIRAARLSYESSISAKKVTDTPLINLVPEGKIRKQQANAGLNAAAANMQQVEMETKNAVNRTYLSYIFAKEQLKVAKEAVETLQATYKVADQLLKSGESKNVTQDDLDKLDIYVKLAESKVGEATVGMQRAKAALREAIGLDYNTKFEIDNGDLKRFFLTAQEYTKSKKIKLCCDTAAEMAVRYRPELAQASVLADVTCLEAQAQSRVYLHFYSRTFAASTDLHSKVLPAMVNNGEYKPGPVGPEMPAFLNGSHSQRTERAGILYDRSLALTDKVRGLVALEAEEGCARLNRASDSIELQQQAFAKSTALYKKAEKSFRQDQLKTDALLTAYALDVKNKSDLNEAYYQFGLTLAYLQRATAGHLWECFIPDNK
ncbi:MAG TPA: TolC family protein [Gemmatales bacterium]|nr:TolC family protein [Gemmatales bacterium]